MVSHPKNWMLLPALLGLFLSGCRPSLETEIANARARILAQVGDDVITVGEFEDSLRQTPETFQKVHTTRAGRGAFLQTLIQRKKLVRLARDLGFEKDPEFKALHDRAQGRMTIQQRDMWLERKLIDHLKLGPLYVSESELHRFFKFYRHQYAQSWAVRKSVLVLPNKNDLKEVTQRLKQGMSLEQISQTLTQQGYVARFIRLLEPSLITQDSPGSEKLLLGLQKGQVTPPQPEGGGYVFVRVDSLEPVTLESVRKRLLIDLERLKLNRWAQKHLPKTGTKIDGKLLYALDLRTSQEL